MSNLLINEPPLQVLPTLASIIGLNESIVLQQLHYWLQNKKIGKWHDDRKWVRNTIDQWQEDNFPFWSTDTVRRIFQRLEERGLVDSTNLNKSAYDRTLWYTINYSTLATCQIPFKHVATMESSNMPTPIPETTTENTSYIYIHPDPEPIAAIKTAIAKVVKTTWKPETADAYDRVAYMIFGFDSTPEKVEGFSEWWEKNHYYDGLPALITLEDEYRNYLLGKGKSNGGKKETKTWKPA